MGLAQRESAIRVRSTVLEALKMASSNIDILVAEGYFIKKNIPFEQQEKMIREAKNIIAITLQAIEKNSDYADMNIRHFFPGCKITSSQEETKKFLTMKRIFENHQIRTVYDILQCDSVKLHWLKGTIESARLQLPLAFLALHKCR